MAHRLQVIAGMKPWIVYRRVLGVLVPVSRFKYREKAKARAEQIRGFYSRVEELDVSMRAALGVKS